MHVTTVFHSTDVRHVTTVFLFTEMSTTSIKCCSFSMLWNITAFVNKIRVKVGVKSVNGGIS